MAYEAVFQDEEHLGDGQSSFGRAGEALHFDKVAAQLQVFNLHENK
jgi:hypothetical protein